MKINDYEDLTTFASSEYSKMSEIYGIVNPSPDFFKSMESTLLKYFKLYDKPLERKLKRQIAIMEAVETMPHGWVWKLFHYDLWQKIKSMPEYSYLFDNKKKDKVENKKEQNSEPVEVLTPTVIKQTTLPDIKE